MNATEIRTDAREQLAALADPDHNWNLSHPHVNWDVVHRKALRRAATLADPAPVLAEIARLYPLATGRTHPTVDAVLDEGVLL